MEPTLYCIMRKDIADNTPGKMMAQSAHAQADFDQWVDDHPGSEYMSDIAQWKEHRSFGRTIVLEATVAEIHGITSLATDDLPAGMTVDPTYPWRNFYGEVFLTSEITCAWVFVCDLTSQTIVDRVKLLPLHR